MVFNILHAVAIETLLFCVLMAMVPLYKTILGIHRRVSDEVMEYCLYVAIQYWICSFAVMTTAVVFDDLRLHWVVVVSLLVLSVYYFLYLPVVFLRPRYSVRGLRILASYATMLAGQAVLLFCLLYIWFSIFPPFAEFRDF